MLFSLKGVEISVDDIIVHAVTIDQLISRLREVFERKRERNLKLNPKKCEFGAYPNTGVGSCHVSQRYSTRPC